MVEQERQHLLVPVAVDQGAQAPRHHRRQVVVVQQARQQARQQLPRPAGLQPVQQVRHHARDAALRHLRHVRVQQHALHQQRQVDPGQRPVDVGLGEHVVGDEAAQRAAQPVLLRRQDRGVRDRQAERMAEQSGDREPVRDPADQSRPPRGTQHVKPAPMRREHRDRRHRHQQP